MKLNNSNIKNSKLFLLLSALSPLEVKKLDKFIASPYFNSRKEVVLLFQYLVKNVGKASNKLSKEVLFKYVFPADLYKDERIRLVMSQLVQLIEKFWVLEEQVKDGFKNGQTLAAVYRKKRLTKPFQQTITSIQNSQDQLSDRSADYYFNQYQLQFEQLNFGSSIRTKDQNIQALSDSLDTAIVLLKLRQVCIALSHQTIFQKEYDFGILPQILGYVEKKKLLSIPAVAFYYHYYLTLIGKDMEGNFYILKQLIFDYGQQFRAEELRGLYIAVINVCIRIVNNGNIQFKSEFMDLYKKGLSSEALLENGILSRFTYQNIVSAGMLSGDYTWTRHFLNDYKIKVEKAYRESAYRFNLGRLAYQQKEYDEALTLLKNTDHKDLLINLFSKTLLLKIYFEIKSFKLLDSFLDAFQIYLRRKKVIGYHKENYQKVIYYTKKLMQLNPFDKKAKITLQTQIQKEDKLLEKEWLLAQLEGS